MEHKINIEYINKKYDASGVSYDVVLVGILVGQIFIPNGTDKKIVLTLNHGMQPFYVNKIAVDVCKKYRDGIIVQMPRKKFEFNLQDSVNTKPKPVVEESWTRYYNFTNQCMGKYREFKSKKRVCIDLVLKKNISRHDAFMTIWTLLKQYPVIKMTFSKSDDAPIKFDESMCVDDIKSILAGILSKKKQPVRAVANINTPVVENTKPEQIVVEKNDEITPVTDDAPHATHIDPMIIAKAVTVTMNKKQTVDAAKQRAQQMANLQYVAVKLLDADGKFICNIYPQDIEKIRAEKAQQFNAILQKQY